MFIIISHEKQRLLSSFWITHYLHLQAKIKCKTLSLSGNNKLLKHWKSNLETSNERKGRCYTIFSNSRKTKMEGAVFFSVTFFCIVHRSSEIFSMHCKFVALIYLFLNMSWYKNVVKNLHVKWWWPHFEQYFI